MPSAHHSHDAQTCRPHRPAASKTHGDNVADDGACGDFSCTPLPQGMNTEHFGCHALLRKFRRGSGFREATSQLVTVFGRKTTPCTS